MTTGKYEELIRRAMKSHTDITVFGAVISLMESSLLSADSQKAEFKIIDICKREQARLIKVHDGALAALSASLPPDKETI